MKVLCVAKAGLMISVVGVGCEEGAAAGVGDRRDVQYLPIVNTTHLSNS